MIKKKILITGCSGFIGKKLVSKLKLKKNVFLYLIITKNKILEKTKNIKYIRCSLLNKKKLKKKIKKLEISDVIHCAWIGVNADNRNSNNQKKNLEVIKSIISSISDKKINSFIALGSQAEYGSINKKIYENAKLNPITSYGKIKVKVCKIIKKFSKKKFRFVWLRIFTGYGPGSNSNWLIPNTIIKLKNNIEINFTHGMQIYNFIYISDIVTAIIKSLYKKKAHGAYNLGHPKSHRVRDIVKLIFTKLKIKKNPSFGNLNYRKDQVMKYLPSISKIKKDLNWTPKYSISRGIDENIKYILRS